MATRFDLDAFNLDNAAFDDAPCAEICRILRDIADRIEDGAVEGPVLDLNGNRLGRYRIDLAHF